MSRPNYPAFCWVCSHAHPSWVHCRTARWERTLGNLLLMLAFAAALYMPLRAMVALDNAFGVAEPTPIYGADWPCLE